MATKYIVIYRPHNTLNSETKYFGPFCSHDAAYDQLCSLPAIGAQPIAVTGVDNRGVKMIEELTEVE